MKRAVIAAVLLAAACASAPPKPDPPPPAQPGRARAALRVTVKVGGAPVAGARVDVSALPGEDDGRTDADGYWAAQFEVLTEPDTYRVEVHVDGFPVQGYDVPLYGADYDLVVDLRRRTARTGVVRLCGRAFCDDGGPFNALGVSLFHALSSYRHHRADLDADLKWASEVVGADYVRVLGVVGGDRDPDPWEFAGAFLSWEDYWQVVAEFNDYAYDRYGLRVEWTIFGGRGQVPSYTAQAAVVERFGDMANERPHKVMHFEIANEYFQNGWGGDYTGMRTLATRLRNVLQHPIPIALSTLQHLESPEEQVRAEIAALYEGSVADLWTPHWSRDIDNVDGRWRNVRKPWEARQFPGTPQASTSNEPMGPGSSVEEERSPLLIAAAAVSAWSTGQAGYVLHSNPGAWGGRVHPHYKTARFEYAHAYEYPEMAGIAAAVRAAHEFLPAGIQNWTHVRHGQDGHPFLPSFRCAPCAQIWPDGHAEGVVRIYAAVEGSEFVVHPIGIRGRVQLTAARAMAFDVHDPLTFGKVQHVELDAGETHVLSGAESYVLRGRYR